MYNEFLLILNKKDTFATAVVLARAIEFEIQIETEKRINFVD